MNYEEGTVYNYINIDEYHSWLMSQKCKWCGAKYSEKPPGKIWMTEWDCGCKLDGGFSAK